MPGKITVTLELDAPEAEILITALRDRVVIEKAGSTIHDVLDRIAYDLEEQVG